MTRGMIRRENTLVVMKNTHQSIGLAASLRVRFSGVWARIDKLTS
jgi:hypothetical protein